MSLDEIKEAVRAGRKVRWKTPAYEVINPVREQWLVQCRLNGHCWGLTHVDGVTMNEKPEDFFILE